MKKLTYYRVTFTLESSLAIGSGSDKNTDSDVAVRKDGSPFIPATAIAGVMRSRLINGNDEDKNKAAEIYGDIAKSRNESKVRFYDALAKAECFITARDCVKLENKVAVDGAKFDFQAVEPGTEFTGYIELNGDEHCNEIETALAEFNSGRLRLGAKTSRGYGKVKVAVKKAAFSIPKDKKAWLDFDMFADKGWSDFQLPKGKGFAVISIKLKNEAGMSIREYSTDVGEEDYRQLALHDDRKTPVIPGTSWAGAFRERFETFTKDESSKELFGYVNEKTAEVQKSKIVFSESKITGGTSKLITRNSIDRFSAATKDGALYTEKTYYCGETELTISMGSELLKEYAAVLAAVLLDLHHGYMAVGGLTAVGRGLFSISEINGKNIDAANEYESVCKTLMEVAKNA